MHALSSSQSVLPKHTWARFPPLSPEDIQLVESWVAQGRTR